MRNLTIAALLLVGLTLGCKLPETLKSYIPGTAPNSNGSTADNSNSPHGSEPATASSDPKEDIVRASKKFLELPSFTSQMDGTGAKELQMKMEYIAPDRYHISHTAGPAAETDTIIVGKDTFMKTGGTWRKLGFDVGGMIPDLRDAFNEEGLKRLTDVKFEGEDNVNGKQALLYSYSSTMPTDKTTFRSKVWIGKDSGLPLKISVDSASGPLKRMTILYDTETPVTIEPPMK